MTYPPEDYTDDGGTMDTGMKIFTGFLSAFASCLLILIILALFFSGPTGEYYTDTMTYKGALAVNEHVKWDQDRVVFAGSTEEALAVYQRLQFGHKCDEE